MQFRIRVLDGAQRLVTLELDALDEADAREQILQRQLTPISISAGRAHTRSAGGRRFSLALFIQELHSLIIAGLSVIESLDALAEKESSAEARAILGRLGASLRQGMRLSAAFQQQSAIFPPLLVGIVQAAEGTSDLPRALQRYIEYESRLDTVRQKVVSAAIYPAVLLVVGGAVSLFLMGFVVPRFAGIYQSAGRTLPWASRALLGWGNFVGAHSMVVVAGFVGLVGGVIAFARQMMRAGGWWRTLSFIPGARRRLELFDSPRLYLTLGMLLEGGIPIQRALQLAGPVLPPGRRSAVDAVCRRIEAGHPLSEALGDNGFGTPVALRLLRVGEQSGQLGEMLTRAAQFYETDTTRWIERFTKVFEPALMAAIGLVIGAIVILLYMPVFDLAGTLQ